MLLYEVFPPELIKIGLEAEDKDEVFEELVDQFCQAEKSNAREDILEALWERESKMSTGVKKGVAIPHAKTSAVGKTCGILGISKKGIDYDALDGKPVQLFFMFLAPNTDEEMCLQLLKNLAELLENPGLIEELLAQNDAGSANEIIRKYESSGYAAE